MMIDISSEKSTKNLDRNRIKTLKCLIKSRDYKLFIRIIINYLNSASQLGPNFYSGLGTFSSPSPNYFLGPA
jgi:hypothetical protein